MLLSFAHPYVSLLNVFQETGTCGTSFLIKEGEVRREEGFGDEYSELSFF